MGPSGPGRRLPLAPRTGVSDILYFLEILRRRWTSCDFWISYGAEMEFLTARVRLLTSLWTSCAPPLEFLRCRSTLVASGGELHRISPRGRLYEAAGRGNVDGTPTCGNWWSTHARAPWCAHFWTGEAGLAGICLLVHPV